MSGTVIVNQSAIANGNGDKIQFCKPGFFRRHKVGVDADGNFSIKFINGKIGLKKGEVWEIKETALKACEKAEVGFQKAKFLAALTDMENGMQEKIEKMSNYSNGHAVYKSLIYPIIRKRLDHSIEEIGNYFRWHRLND